MKIVLSAVGFFLFFILYCLYLKFYKPININNDVTVNMVKVSESDLTKLLMSQRNELVTRYNEMSKKAAILSCEMENLKNRAKNGETIVSITGGWCEILSDDVLWGRAARDLVYAMSHFLAGKRVGSFGDGPGTYKMLIDRDNRVTSYDAFDGGPYYNITSKGKVKYMDLTAPQYGLPLYDWVISLEVAEHIDAKYEAIFLSNVVRHAAEGVIISWAVPGQPGLQHINCKPFSYVIDVMATLGFYFSTKESDFLRQSTQNIHYKRNVSVFRRNSSHPVDLNMI